MRAARPTHKHKRLKYWLQGRIAVHATHRRSGRQTHPGRADQVRRRHKRLGCEKPVDAEFHATFVGLPRPQASTCKQPCNGPDIGIHDDRHTRQPGLTQCDRTQQTRKLERAFGTHLRREAPVLDRASRSPNRAAPSIDRLYVVPRVDDCRDRTRPTCRGANCGIVVLAVERSAGKRTGPPIERT